MQQTFLNSCSGITVGHIPNLNMLSCSTTRKLRILQITLNHGDSTSCITQNIRHCQADILRRIFGPTQKANGEWRLKTNEELEEAINNENIVRYIKYKRLSWLGHVERMTNERVADILRRIFGPTQKANAEWRLNTNEELKEAINNEIVARYIKYKRLSWLGHVERMTNERVAKTI